MKKDETRFTIRFNAADPRHQRTMRVLERAGRRKASLIADAVCEYLARHEDGATSVILPQITVPTPVKQTSTGDEKNFNSADKNSSDDAFCKVILAGLNAFNM